MSHRRSPAALISSLESASRSLRAAQTLCERRDVMSRKIAHLRADIEALVGQVSQKSRDSEDPDLLSEDQLSRRRLNRGEVE